MYPRLIYGQTCENKPKATTAIFLILSMMRPSLMNFRHDYTKNVICYPMVFKKNIVYISHSYRPPRRPIFIKKVSSLNHPAIDGVIIDGEYGLGRLRL